METKKVRFLPYDMEIPVAKGENLLQTAIVAGVYINASCGGEGVCGKCKVFIEKGRVESKRTEGLSQAEYDQGYRQSCQTTILDDLEVRVPVESYLDKRVLERIRQREIGGRSPSHHTLEHLVEGWCYDPLVCKYLLKVDPPTSGDRRFDLSRLLVSLQKRILREYTERPKDNILPSLEKGGRFEPITVDFRVLHALPHVLRHSNWEITATVVHAGVHPREGMQQLTRSKNPQLIRVESGDTTKRHYSLALDIGTTSVCGQMLDMNKGQSVAESSDYNAQISYGDDVITRIIYSQRPGGLERLQQKIVFTINHIIKDLLKKVGISVDDISYIAVAGNTTMTHLLCSLDPKYIRESPYIPVANYIPPVRATNLGIDVSEHVQLYTFPSVASYVGGDIVAGILASGIYKKSALSLYMDIGTNGEVVIGNSEWLITASCSAGPAFEGSGIHHGMRATTGAVEDFRINPVTYEPMIITIGRVKPKGICGSGLINVMAELFEAQVIDRSGKFNANLPTNRIRKGEYGDEYVLAWANDTQINQDIVITEPDIDNLIRAKAAMYAGCAALLESTGLKASDLHQIIITGAFGNFIDLERSILIGLLPELPLEKFLFIGNGSLLGATAICFCRNMVDDAERIAKMMTNVELTEYHPFMEKYIAALFLPHTNEAEFPKMNKRLATLQQPKLMRGVVA